MVSILNTPETAPESFLRNVMYNDIDLNHHLTTTKYIDYALDCFSTHFLETNNCVRIIVNFIREIPVGSEIQINRYTIEHNKAYLFEFVIPKENKVCFRGEFLFSEIE